MKAIQLDNHAANILGLIEDAATVLQTMTVLCGNSDAATKQRDTWLEEAASFIENIPEQAGLEYLHCLHLTVIDAGHAMKNIIDVCAPQHTLLIKIWKIWVQKVEVTIDTALKAFRAFPVGA